MAKKQVKVNASVKANVALVAVCFNILASFESVIRDFSRRREPNDNSKAPMTNATTQTFGNRTVSGRVVWSVGKESREVVLEAWQPARDANGRELRRNAPAIRHAYATRQVSESNAVAEAFQVLSYFALSIASGQLPSPTRRSAESTLKGLLLNNAMQESGYTIQSLTLTGANGESVEYPAAAFLGILAAFVSNAEAILQWPTAGGRGQARLAEVDFL
jgi:hypothetical protein